MPGETHGSEAFTADSVVGTSGIATRVYSATWLSGTTLGDLVLRNGTGATDTIYVNQTGDADDTVTQNWEGGLLFPGGCFFDKDTNVTRAVIEFSEEK